jgi:hypothetical protein
MVTGDKQNIYITSIKSIEYETFLENYRLLYRVARYNCVSVFASMRRLTFHSNVQGTDYIN